MSGRPEIRGTSCLACLILLGGALLASGTAASACCAIYLIGVSS